MQHPVGWMFFLFLIFFLGGGINLLVVWNHYLHDKNKQLVLSREQPYFLFGTGDQIKRYSKSDIRYIVITRTNNKKGTLGEMACFDILFKNNQRLQFSSLLVAEGALIRKFYDQPIRYIHSLPFYYGRLRKKKSP